MITASMTVNLQRLWNKNEANTTHEKKQAPQSFLQKSIFLKIFVHVRPAF